MRLRLVEDWRRCHKWWSVRLIAIGSVVQTAVLTASSTGLDKYLQPALLTYLSDAALFCMIAAGIGRVIDQPTETNHDSDKPVQS